MGTHLRVLSKSFQMNTNIKYKLIISLVQLYLYDFLVLLFMKIIPYVPGHALKV